MKNIRFNNTKNEVIIGKLLHHDTTKPLIIICHGYSSSMENPSLKSVSESLYKLGHNVFTFNFSQSAQTTSLEEQVVDVEAIIAYFADYKKFVLLGASFGALTSAIASQTSKKVKGLITINGFFGTRHLGETWLKTYLAFRAAATVHPRHKKIWNYMKTMHQPSRIEIPVLVIHSRVDKDVFIKQSEFFYNALVGTKKFYTLEDADHALTTKKAVNEVVGVIDTWLKSTIE